MQLTRHLTSHGPRWAYRDRLLPAGVTLGLLLELPAAKLGPTLETLVGDGAPDGEPDGALLPPIEADQEIWASGVTYLRSRVAREEESESSADVYTKVYDAARPELFFKSVGWRAVGHGDDIRIRADSSWNVPEPELTLVINAHGEIIGYTVGNDVSSRSIEGENPLYLPQAKMYNGAAAIGPAIKLAAADTLRDLPVTVAITRGGDMVFAGDTRTSQMKRNFEELVQYLYREMDFPHGALLMTGTGIVPGDDFTLQPGDVVTIDIDGMTLKNRVA